MALKKNTNNGTYVVRLVRDARYTPATNAEGTNAALFFTGACNDGYTNRQGDEVVSYIDFRLSGKRADSLHQYLVKGTQIAIARSRLRTWTQQDGEKFIKRYVVDVEELEFLSAAKHSEQGQAPAGEPEEIELDVSADDLPF